MRKSAKNSLMSLVILVGLFISVPINVSAASITVNDTCSLANAIAAANTDTATGGCAAGSGVDTITLTGNLTLPTTESDIVYVPRGIFDPVPVALPVIASDITIQGGGYTISGNDAYRIFHISSGTATINNVALTKGSAHRAEGGAIYVAGGNVTITNSSFTDNTAYWGAAIYSNGTLSIRNSVFNANEAVLQAGAIKNAIGTLTITSSTFTNNSAHDNSGAIMNGGTLSIANSTFSGNSANFDYSRSSGGAIYTDAVNVSISGSSFSGNSAHYGGAINNFNALNISNSTFSGNRAAQYGGAIRSSSSATITHSTISGNTAGENKGGGIQNDSGTMNLRNSIISGNTGGDCVGGLNQNVNNLIQDGTCSPTLSGDPKLGTLTGSPAYFPLLSDSPAINAAHVNHCLTTDQAGKARPYPTGGVCDIGAFELQSGSSSATDNPESTDATETPVPATATDTPVPAMPVDPTLTPTPTPLPTEFCVSVSSGTYWLFPADPIWDGGFLSGLITEYPSSACEDEETTQTSIGDDGYVYTTGEWIDASVLCLGNHGSDVIIAARDPLAYNSDVWPCESISTSTPVSPTSTPVPQTDTPAPTATPTETCANVGPGSHWLFPAINFLSGLITAYISDTCDENLEITQTVIGDDGYVYTAHGQAAAVGLCAAGNNDGETYTVTSLPYNSDVWQCSLPPTSTPIPPTSTPIPPTDTPVPTATVATAPGKPTNLSALIAANGIWLSWTAPGDDIDGYQILRRRPRMGEGQLLIHVENTGNNDTSYLDTDVSGDDEKYVYRIKAIRAGMLSNRSKFLDVFVLPGDFLVVQQQQQEEPTATPIPPTNMPVPTATNTPIPTSTPIPPTNMPVPPTSTPTPVPPTNTPVPPTSTPVPPTNTQVPPLARPENLTASVVANGVTLNWDAPAGQVDGYEILRRRPHQGEETLQTLVADTGSSATTYTDTTATESTRYTYRVKAIRNGERSKQSKFARVDR